MALLPPAKLAALHQARELLLGRGWAVLAAWALVNLVVSGYWLARADRRYESYYFHGLNVGWGLVNAGLTFWGIWRWHPTPPADLRLADLFQAQVLNETLFLFSTGLDVAYIMTGFYLRAQAGIPRQPRPARLLGFGRSLWMQGSFLLVFDAGMWNVLHWQGKTWLPFLV